MPTLDREYDIIDFTDLEDLNQFISKLDDLDLRRDLICLRESAMSGDASLNDWSMGLTPCEVKLVEGLLDA